jgi:hypothetical protein
MNFDTAGLAARATKAAAAKIGCPTKAFQKALAMG